MFSRASISPYVCLRCQCRLRPRDSSLKPRIDPPKSSIYRWQTTLASTAQEDKHDDELPFSRSVDPQRHSFDRLSTRRTWPSHRRWTPAPTAALTDNVLGKPAEVLVLPHGGRRKKRKISDQGEDEVDVDLSKSAPESDEPRTSILETISDETKPVSAEEVAHSIDGVRKELGAVNGYLDTETWRKCRTNLSSAFNTIQLQRYVSQNNDPTLTEGEKSRKSHHAKHLKKVQLADFIISKIWKCSLRDESTGEFRQKVETGSDQRTLFVKCNKIEQLGLTNVKIEEHSTGFRITGANAQDVALAREAINKARRQIISKPYDLNTSPNELHHLLEKHPVVVHFNRKDQCRTAYAFSSRDLANFERDFILMRDASGNITETFDTPIKQSFSRYQMPVYANVQALNAGHYYRSMENSLGVSGGSIADYDQNSTNFNNFLLRLGKDMVDTPVTTKGFDISLGVIRTVGQISSEFTMDLGQSLQARETLQEKHKDWIRFSSPFQSRLPLLTQFVAQQQPFDCHNNALLRTLPRKERGNPRILRISLKPNQPQSYPSVEIYSTLRGSSNIHVHEISLHFGHIAKAITLPATIVDLRASRRDKLLIFRTGAGFQTQYTPLMVCFTQQLVSKNGRAGTGLILNPLFKLDLSCLNTTASSDEGNATENLPSEAGYVLDRVEWVDRTIFHTPTASPFLVEYLSYTPLRESSSQEPRQTLRLVEMPLLHYYKLPEERYMDGSLRAEADQLAAKEVETVISDSPVRSTWLPHVIGTDDSRFREFVRTGYDLALSFNAFVNNKTKEIASHYPSLDA